MKHLSLLIHLFILTPLISQSTGDNFRSPVDYPTVLSGSYAEPRSKHFHAGIDFKPSLGVPYDTIRAIEDGFISRINVMPDGYGNALYIEHANGYTSVYAHLHEFSAAIREYIEAEMYKLKRYKIEHYPSRAALLVKKGEPIGILGNSGRSSGPHLHFEIRGSRSQIPMNPALFGLGPVDRIPPTIKGLFIYYLTYDDQILYKKYYPVVQTSSTSYNLPNDQLEAGALMIGLGVHTFDTMNGASNHNGIYAINCTVDGQPSFNFELNKISFERSKYIHTHMDYEEKVENRYVTKCFKEDANPLPIYQVDSFMGKIHLYEDIPRRLFIQVRDYAGNISDLTFSIKRSRELSEMSLDSNQQSLRIMPSDSLKLTFLNHSIEFVPGTFVTPFNFLINEFDSLNIDLEQTKPIPLFDYFKISSKIKGDQKIRSKLLFTAKNKKDEIVHYGGKWENDSTLVTFADELQKYSIQNDTVSPSITIISLPGPNSNRIKFTLKDNFIPAYKGDQLQFEVLLDNDWILCKHDGKNDAIWHDLTFSRNGQTHQLKIWAKDATGNTVNRALSFTY